MSSETGQNVAVLLGSAFDAGSPSLDLLPEREVPTAFGPQPVHPLAPASREVPGEAFVLFRHGAPHRLLPHQIDFRRQAAALAALDCGALLVTSSVGVLRAEVPLHRPLLVGDLLTLDNRLPDGSACTMWTEASPDQGHLVLEEGLFSPALSEQVAALGEACELTVGGPVVFGYVAGPRTKTPAENRLWRQLGAEVNSMSLGPEVVLANELGIPCAGLVLGHKRSLEEGPTLDREGIRRSLREGRDALETLVAAFLARGRPVPFGNHLYRFREER